MRKTIKGLLAAMGLALAVTLVPVSGSGMIGQVTAQAASVYTVRVESGYLALRTAKAYDYNNEIGKLYTGQTVEVQDTSDSQYWWVYAPSLGKNGYVNKDYLVASAASTAPAAVSSQFTIPAYTVSVSSGYLALRSAQAFDSSNEIAQLNNGEKVLVTNYESKDQYWYVFSASKGKFGYVDRNYLVSGASVTISAKEYNAKVASGYLALRTAKAFDSANEIGKLYTGQSVWVLDDSDSQYWYAYAPTLQKMGYINKDYLTTEAVSASTTKTVRVESGYLALRTAKAFDYNNEIGKLYTGETVEVQDTSDSQYWWVYAPTLGKYGYVNKDYLY